MNSNAYRIVLYFIGAIAVLAVGFVGLDLYFNKGAQTGNLAWKPLAKYIPVELDAAIRAGNNDKALAEYQEIMTEPSSEAETKAMAVINVSSLKFRTTGNVEDALADVRELKKIAVDTNLTMRTRGAAVSALARSFNGSGRNQIVFQEIFNSAPFSDDLVAGDPDVSSMKLSELAYEMRWASASAIFVSHVASGQPYAHPEMDAATKAMFIAKAEDYLKKAEAAVEKEVIEIPDFYTSHRYMTYRVWRVIVIGRLAGLKGEPYKSTYKKEYESFLQLVADNYKSIHAKNQAYYGRFQYALALHRNDEDESAKVQLDTLAQLMGEAMNTEDAIEYFSFLRNEKANGPDSDAWKAIEILMGISPDFKTAVNKVVS